MTTLPSDFFDSIDRIVAKKQTIIKAPFGWPGGKSRVLDWLLPLIPERNTYVDVFGGSGIVLFNRKRAKNEVYNDINSGIVSLYRCLRDDRKQAKLCEWLRNTVHAYEEWVYCRETWKDVNDDVERAGRWIYMMRYSFAKMGGAYGFNITGTNPHSASLSLMIPRLNEIKRRLEGVNIENADWRIILQKYDHPDTVFYLDPPYPETNQRSCYGSNITSWEDHREMMRIIENMQGTVVLSGYANPIYDSETFWTDRFETEAQVSIGGKSERQHKATEVVWRILR